MYIITNENGFTIGKCNYFDEAEDLCDLLHKITKYKNTFYIIKMKNLTYY